MHPALLQDLLYRRSKVSSLLDSDLLGAGLDLTGILGGSILGVNLAGDIHNELVDFSRAKELLHPQYTAEEAKAVLREIGVPVARIEKMPADVRGAGGMAVLATGTEGPRIHMERASLPTLLHEGGHLRAHELSPLSRASLRVAKLPGLALHTGGQFVAHAPGGSAAAGILLGVVPNVGEVTNEVLADVHAMRMLRNARRGGTELMPLLEYAKHRAPSLLTYVSRAALPVASIGGGVMGVKLLRKLLGRDT